MNDGWTLSELAWELRERGIDIDEVSDHAISQVLNERSPDYAADRITAGDEQA